MAGYHHDQHPHPHHDHHDDHLHRQHRDQPDDEDCQALHSNPTPGGLGLAGAPPIHFTQVQKHHNHHDDNSDDDDDVDGHNGDNDGNNYENNGDNKHCHCHPNFREAWPSSKQEMVTIGHYT